MSVRAQFAGFSPFGSQDDPNAKGEKITDDKIVGATQSSPCLPGGPPAMSYTGIAYRLPRFLRRHILHFEVEIEDAVADFALALPKGARVLDAGSGEGQYGHHFTRHRYTGVDLGVGDAGWDYSKLDAVADLTALPFAAGSFDAAIHIVTIEHLREPGRALEEIARALRPDGTLLIAAPHEWEVHQAPHDYFRYTRYGLAYLLERAGMQVVELRPAGGYFRLLARRLLNGLQFFTGGLRWLLFVPAALLLVPPALILPFLDFLDRDCNFTLGYVCKAKKHWTASS
jgi:SAM-dependent methyltransferase